MAGGVHGFASQVGTLFGGSPVADLLAGGFEFLFSFIKPLDDLLGMVTGNPTRMEVEIDSWDGVREGLGPIAEGVSAAWDSHLRSWQGGDAEKAREKVQNFGEAIGSLENSTIHLQTLVRFAKIIAEALQDKIFDILAKWVEKNILQWIIAFAKAKFSFGSSVIIQTAISKIQAAMAYLEGTEWFNSAMDHFNTFLEVVDKINNFVGEESETFIEIGLEVGSMVSHVTGSDDSYSGDRETDLSFSDLPSDYELDCWLGWTCGTNNPIPYWSLEESGCRLKYQPMNAAPAMIPMKIRPPVSSSGPTNANRKTAPKSTAIPMSIDGIIAGVKSPIRPGAVLSGEFPDASTLAEFP